MRRLNAHGADMVIYKPALSETDHFISARLTTNLEDFKASSDVIIVNRMTPEL